MHNDELWQVYANNGTAIPNRGATREEFKADPSLNMGNAHVWFWKSDGKQIEIMLQKRSLNTPDRPGWYHISAGGHVNVGETPLQAATREVAEEMGYVIDPAQLYFVQTVRTIQKDPRDIVNVFLYRLKGDEKFTYPDGEAGSYEWRTIENFKEITKDAANNNLVPQGNHYFGILIATLEYIAK